MAMIYRLIKSPNQATREMLMRRIAFGRQASERDSMELWDWGSVLILQGTLPDIFYAADIGEKASSVRVAEVIGNCPQNVVAVAFVGKMTAVETVLSALKNKGVVA